MNKVTIIAEIGINHNGSRLAANSLIDQAKIAGADIAKFQLYDVDKVFPQKEILIEGKNWYEEVKKTQLTKKQMLQVVERCEGIGIEFMASCFDLERFKWLEEVGVKRHKLANWFRNEDVIKAMRETRKEILLSLSPKNPYVPNFLLSYTNLTVLYCVPEYPTSLRKLHLGEVGFPFPYKGFSDHTVGIDAACIAVSRGALVIEKHFTLDKGSNRGPDHICSVEPSEFRQLVNFVRRCEEAL